MLLLIKRKIYTASLDLDSELNRSSGALAKNGNKFSENIVDILKKQLN